MLIQDILLAPHCVWCFKDYLFQPAALLYNLNTFPWIPLKYRVLAQGRVDGHLVGTVTDIQHLFQRLFQRLSELVLFFNLLPKLLLSW